MRLTRSVLAGFWLVCVLGSLTPLPAHAQFVLEIRTPHAQLDPAMRSLAQACSGALNAAAAVSNSGDLNADLSNVAVSMVTGNRTGLESELQDRRRYAAAVGPGGERTRAGAGICIREAALNGGDAPLTTPPGPEDGAVDLTDEWLDEESGYAGSPAPANGGISIIDLFSGLSNSRGGAPFIAPAKAPAPAPRPSPEPSAPKTSPRETAVARVRLAGLFGTRCVIPGIRNVRRPQEANPTPTSWVGDWVLTNHCPTPQWVRIEVDTLGHLTWAGLQTPGARMQPSPALEPSLAFQPIRESDFHFGWLVPANGELVTAAGDMVHPSVMDRGMDVWIASCDGIGDARRQAIYLSAPFRDNPRVACWNHALPNGGGDGR